MSLEKNNKKPQQNPCIQKTLVSGNHGPGTVLASDDRKKKKTKISALAIYWETDQKKKKESYTIT